MPGSCSRTAGRRLVPTSGSCRSRTDRGRHVSGFVLEPNGGAAYGFHGSRVLIKASGDDTLGQLTVLESIYPPGLSVHVHVHDGEDEMFYVIAGEIAGTCGGENWIARPGSFVFVPRHTPHSLTVTSGEPATGSVST